NSLISVCLLGILLGGNSWLALYLFVGLMAVFYGVTFPIYGACAGDYFPKQVLGTVIGAWTPFYGLGAVLVHWVSGILRDTTGSYYYAFMINAAMAAMGAIMICAVRKDDAEE
ncbi:MAG: MFS transporter, partial [Desulfobacterales bacterium]|nr:MFS transporter [Desulfobacterales bacterium]